MKNKLLLILFALLPFISLGQGTRVTAGAPTQYNYWKGGVGGDSIFVLPFTYAVSWSWMDSCRRMWMQSGNIYFHDCTNRVQMLSLKDTNFIKSLIASGGNVTWNNITGKPSVFPPDTTIAITTTILNALFPSLFTTQLSTKTTDNLTEGGTNKYYTDARAALKVNYSDSVFKYVTPTSFTGLFNTQFGTKTTTNLPEGSNLYYTDTRVQIIVGNDTNANKLSTPTSVQSQVNTSAATKVNIADIQKSGDASNKYDINGSNPFTFHVPYTTYYQMLFSIGTDSLCRVYIVDSTNNEQTPDHNYVFRQFNYCGGCYSGWTTPTILFNDSIGHPYDELSGGQNNTGTYTIFTRMRNNSNGIYTNYLTYSTNKCQTFTPLVVFPANGFRDSQPIPHGRLIKADSGKFYQFFYGFGAEKYGQLAKSTDLINWTAAQLVFDTTVTALSETGLAYCGKDSIVALIRGIGTGTTYLMKTSIDNGNTWSGGVKLTNLGRDTLFNDVSPCLIYDTIRQRLISINTQRFINGSVLGRQSDRLTFYINKPSEIWNNPLSWSYKATILRPQPNTLNIEGYPSIVQMDSTHFFGVFTDAIKYGINSSGQFVSTGGESTYGYWFTMNYDSVNNFNHPVNSNGVAIYKAATNSYDWLNQPWPITYDSITHCYMLRFQGQLAWDISGNNSMSAGSVFSTDSMGRWYVIAPGTTGQKLTMQSTGYPAWQTGGAGTVTSVTCGNIASGGNIWSSSVSNGSTTPAISFNIVNQTAHFMFGNHTGSPASPTMALLTTGDIPIIPLSTGVSGTLPAAQFPALTGDVTTSAGAVATTIAANAVGNSKLAQMAANTIKLNNTGSTANAIDGTIAQLNTMLGIGVHSIFIPTTGGTVNVLNNQTNIINPAGSLLTLTINLPSSPANNDKIYIKFTQAITTLNYTGGTVADNAPVGLGTLVYLTYDSGTTTWY